MTHPLTNTTATVHILFENTREQRYMAASLTLKEQIAATKKILAHEPEREQEVECDTSGDA